MSNNNSSVDTCHNPDWLPQASQTLIYINYYIMPPVVFFVSWIPSVFTAIAFNYQYHKEEAFIYQRVYIAHVSVQGIVMVTFSLGRRLTGWAGVGGQKWFTTNYYLMWYTAHLGSPVLNSTILISMMLLTSMACDRVLAMAAPVYYQSMKRKRLAIYLITSSYLLGVSASIFDLPRIQLATNGDEYRLATNSEYTSLLIVKVLSMLRNVLTMIFALSLGLFNTIALILFARQSKKSLLHRSTNRERENKRLERSLVTLAVTQGYLVFIEQPLMIADFALVYINPQLSRCILPLLSPGLETSSQMFYAPNIIQLYLFNRPFTAMLRKLPLIQRFISDGSEVAKISIPVKDTKDKQNTAKH